MKKLFLLGIIFIMGITGCSYGRNNSVEVGILQSELNYTDIELYVKEEGEPGVYEPEEGIYLGAYVEGNTELAGKMATYEELFQAKQAFRVYQFNPKEPLTEQDLLRCIAEEKTPYIKLMMPEEYDITVVYQLIGSLRSKFSTPIFIELFPVTENLNDPAEYKRHYQEAYELIKKYLSTSVIVWSTDLEKSHESQLYYPGDHLVDWAGLNVYLPRYRNEKIYEPQLAEKLDFWYKQFQSRKPLMLSTLAISHFSRWDHTYTVAHVQNQLEFFYEEMPRSFPRIKAILYADIDMAQMSKNGMDDYRISSQPELRDYLTGVWRNTLFLHHLIEPIRTTYNEYVKYTVPAIEHNNRIYIELEYAKKLFKTSKIKKDYLLEDEEGKQYYDISDLIQESEAYYVK